MIVCPVCEHAQVQGAECEVCGKRLGPPSAADPPVARVDGLEPTGHAPVDAPEAPVPELEPTRYAPASHALDVVPGLEATAAAPVDVDVPPAPDLERASEPIPGDAPTALPAVPLCRYCRTPAGPAERICARCGMRLPVLAASGVEEASGDAGWSCSCGLVARGGMCPGCGARRPTH